MTKKKSTIAATKSAAASSTETKKEFSVQKVYVKALSFETPKSPETFKLNWQPDFDMRISNTTISVSEGIYDIVLSVMAVVKIDDQIVYTARLDQAGVFIIAGIEDDIKVQIQETVCLNTLLPFARETLSNIVVRAGFPQILLAPVNFEARYQKKKEKRLEANDTNK